MFDNLLHILRENSLVAGGATMALVGWGLVQAKAIPLKLWHYCQDQFSSTLTIYSEDDIWQKLDVWLARHPSAKHSRRFSVAAWHNRAINDQDYAMTPGAGFHLMREGRRLFLVHRTVEDKTGGNDSFNRRRAQTVTLTAFGRSKVPLEELLIAIKTVQEDHSSIPVHLWQGHDYALVERRPKRPMDTVYATQEAKARIIGDAEKFLSNRAWYAERGIPYRRGYLLEGPPGTGKTTMIFALASQLDKPIYIINPASISNDNELQRAVNAAGSNIVVIEDIDALLAAESRDTKERGPLATGDANKSGITLSGLLNAIDGIGARDGRLLFITSNQPEVLDAALLRPGRVDCRVHLGHASAVEAAAMFKRFFPERDPTQFLASIESRLPISPADLQNQLLGLVETAA